MYCLINEQECFIRFKTQPASLLNGFKHDSANSIETYCLISILYIKNTNTIDTALLVFFIIIKNIRFKAIAREILWLT